MNPKAFTLIELLVVLVIVLLLISLLLPTLSSARNSSRNNSCLSNLRQAQLAVEAYRSDNKGWLPLDLPPATLRCPSDRFGRYNLGNSYYIQDEGSWPSAMWPRLVDLYPGNRVDFLWDFMPWHPATSGQLLRATDPDATYVGYLNASFFDGSARRWVQSEILGR